MLVFFCIDVNELLTNSIFVDCLVDKFFFNGIWTKKQTLITLNIDFEFSIVRPHRLTD